MASVYDSERLAAAYAFDRPSVHGQFVRSAGLSPIAGRALDIGCGAGLSTAALAPLARLVVGLEPVPAMLAHRRTVAPRARFVIAGAERLPFGDASFGLVAAAGSLNYAGIPAALSEVARVLTQDGTFLLYDFSPPRRSASGGDLERWFTSFEQRFPWPPGWEPLEVRELPLTGHGLRLHTYAEVEARLTMTFDAYLRYMLSETNAEHAIASGAATAGQVRDWCEQTLRAVFTRDEVTVLIPGYVATLGRAGGQR
ncbi:MAG TPA: methyltransferase domain-containing protein [Trebonia sp.]|jgi:SAM-dependent methyltransferase|nr:methyltransferase domain-containing protein [Trebonia sp.]